MSRDLAVDPPGPVQEAQAALSGRVSTECPRPQIEVGTGIWRLRREGPASSWRICAEPSSRLPAGLAWHRQAAAPLRRLGGTAARQGRALQHLWRASYGPVRRLHDLRHACSCRPGSPELRIDLMSRASYFLAASLALSTSSPFWSGGTGPDRPTRNYGHAAGGSSTRMPRAGAGDLRSPWATNISAISTCWSMPADRGRFEDLVGSSAQRALSPRWS